MDLAQIVRDPAWQFILGIVGIFVAVIAYLRQRELKELSYEIISKSESFIPEALRKSSNFKVLYNNQTLQDPGLITIRFINTGNKSIKPEEYVKGIRLNLLENNIVGYEILDASNNDLRNELLGNIKLETSNSETDLIIDAILLNKKDWFTIQIIAANPRKLDPLITARIIDIHSLKVFGRNKKRVMFFYL